MLAMFSTYGKIETAGMVSSCLIKWGNVVPCTLKDIVSKSVISMCPCLISIDHSFEKQDASDLANTTPGNDINNTMWTGLVRILIDFYWTDGTLFDYTNWDAGEPNNSNATESCVEVNYTTGTKRNRINK